MIIPVLFRTYNRLQYLYYTLRSFCSTSAKYRCSIEIIDDCSNENNIKKFLYTNEQFQYNFNFLSDNRFVFYRNVINKDFSKLNPLKKMVGIGKSFQVTKTEKKLGDKAGLLWTLKHGFQKNPNSEFIIILQNDVLFTEKWLDKLLYIYNKHKDSAGIISCWNLNNDYLKNSIQIQDYLKLNKNQGIGFQVALITKKFYKQLMLKYSDIFEKQFQPFPDNVKQNAQTIQKYNIAGDYYLLKHCYLLNFDVFSTKYSYVQHIGVGSTTRKWEKTAWYRSIIMSGDFQYKQFSVGNVYIFSNIQSKQILDIYPNDICIFLNNAKNFNQYKNANCKKILFRRYLISQKKYAGTKIDNIQNYYINGQLNNLPISYENLIKQYDFNYKTTVKTKQPTTGWLVYQLCKKIFPYHNIKLVNFLPDSDFSTQHDLTHNWKFQSLYYKNNHVDIIDTREKSIFSKQELYIKLHEIKKDYGSDSHRFFNQIMNLIANKNIHSILDYGCGRATLYNIFKNNKINIQFYNYDFAIPQYMKFPQNKKFDLVVCTDVLQHVPQNQLKLVLAQIISVSNKSFFCISCRNAINRLPNGQSCHCTIKKQQWWLDFLKKYYNVINKMNSNNRFQLVCYCQK